MIRKTEIINKANEIIAKFKITEPEIDIYKIVNDLGLKIEFKDLGTNVSGVFMSNGPLKLIGINDGESEVRKRFTVAHELGHYLLHSKEEENIFITKKHFRDIDSTTGELRQEREANLFAACILMPENMIEREVDKIHLKQRIINPDDLTKEMATLFKVSEIAMSYRLSNLGYIYS